MPSARLPPPAAESAAPGPGLDGSGSHPREPWRLWLVIAPLLLGACLVAILAWHAARVRAFTDEVGTSDRVMSAAQRAIETLSEPREAAAAGTPAGPAGTPDTSHGPTVLRDDLDQLRRLLRGDQRQLVRLDGIDLRVAQWLTCVDSARPPAGPDDCAERARAAARDALRDLQAAEGARREARRSDARLMARRTLLTGSALAVLLSGIVVLGARRQAERLSRHSSRALAEAARQAVTARENEALLAGVIDSAMDAVIAIDERQRIVVFNHAAERLFQQTAPQMHGEPVDRLIPGRLRDLHRQEVARFAATETTPRPMGRAQPLVGLRADGSEVPLEGTIAPARVGDRTLLTAVLRDLTAPLAAERALKESEQRFRLMVEGVQDYAIFMLDRDGRVVSWNQGAARITGCNAAEVIGVPVDRFYTPEDRDAGRPAEQLRAALERGLVHVEARRVRRDGTHYWAEETTTTLRDGAGEFSGYANLVRDITDRKEAEHHVQQLHQRLQEYAAELERRVEERTSALREINAELDSFAHSVSHDLRAPLRSMEGFAQALVEDHGPQLGNVGREYARRIAASASHLDALIHDLLAYSRVSRTEIALEPVEVSAALDAALAQLAPDVEERGADVTVAGRLPPVIAHHATLVQVLVNLLGNALKFVAPGQPPRVVVGADAGQAWVRVWIEDNGIGIAPEHRERIFRVFERLHGADAYPGTGIGLAIVRKGVERMGGRCGLESAVGRGSRFWIELPRGDD